MTSRIGAMIKLATAGLLFLSAACASQPGPSPQTSGTVVKQKIGRPYQIGGNWYYPKAENGYDQVGIASWYGEKFHGAPTANGEIFDMNRLSAAHTTLPLPSWVEVTNLDNGSSLVVRVNDRGPFVDGRLIDLSKAAAAQLGFLGRGVTRVRVRLVEAPGGVETAGAQPSPVSEPEPVEIASLEPVLIPEEEPASEPASNLPAPIRQPAGKPAPAAQQTASITGEIPHPLRKPDTPSPAVKSAATSPGTSFLVQVATFINLDYAERLVASFDISHSAFLTPYTQEDGRVFNRVRLGPFNSRADAEAALNAAREKGLNDARIFLKKG